MIYGDIEHPKGYGGTYKYPTAQVYGANRLVRHNTLRIAAAELFHAHQSTIADNSIKWLHTPEGGAYLEAERKDFEEVGRFYHYDKKGISDESASSLFSRYWQVNYTTVGNVYREEIKKYFPNRYRWAEE